MNLGRLNDRTPGEMTAPGAAACYIGETRVLLADRDTPKTAPWERDRNVQFAAVAWNNFEPLLLAVEEALNTSFFECNCQDGPDRKQCNGSCTYSTLKNAAAKAQADVKKALG